MEYVKPVSQSSSTELPTYQDHLRQHWHDIRAQLEQVRRHRSDTIPVLNTPEFLPDIGAESLPETLAALGASHLDKATRYWISHETCATAFEAPGESLPQHRGTELAPTPNGLAVLTMEYLLPSANVECNGMQWGRVDNGWWVVPLTYARHLGMTPEASLAPMSLGYHLPDRGPVSSADPDRLAVSAIILALWQLVTAPQTESTVSRSGAAPVLVVAAHSG